MVKDLQKKDYESMLHEAFRLPLSEARKLRGLDVVGSIKSDLPPYTRFDVPDEGGKFCERFLIHELLGLRLDIRYGNERDIDFFEKGLEAHLYYLEGERDSPVVQKVRDVLEEYHLKRDIFYPEVL